MMIDLVDSQLEGDRRPAGGGSEAGETLDGTRSLQHDLLRFFLFSLSHVASYSCSVTCAGISLAHKWGKEILHDWNPSIILMGSDFYEAGVSFQNGIYDARP